MSSEFLSAFERRTFLKLAGAASAASLAPAAIAAPAHGAAYLILLDANDTVASAAPVRWAAEQLRNALTSKSAQCRIADDASAAHGAAFCVVVAGADSAMAKTFPHAAGSLDGAESFRLAAGRSSGVSAVLVSGSDVRGFVYGLLELAERVRFGSAPATDLHLTQPVVERPANELRSVSRYFSSEIEDKPWFYDREFWGGYLDLLAASRFNRFSLAFGLQYDFPRGVTDDYIHLPYPYLFDVPGYDVRVMTLASADGKPLATPVAISAEEKKKNLESLQFIAAQTAARGLQFQLGIWTHAYQWVDSPKAYHRIEGLTAETHAAYCRDALALVLKQIPEITGLTMRVHGESGIPEGSYSFWQTLFDAIKNCGRTVEIDMHAKGVDQKMIDIALNTGMPIKLGAKYAAEHQSLGYHQADIRTLEMPKPTKEPLGPFALSAGARSFTRYGYADFLTAGNKARVWFRLWPGTQRHLLSADPEMAAAYGRTSHLCGAAGLDLMEPLTFKGREGSGYAGGRLAYADASLNPASEWQKFELYYRVWGRKLYNPDAAPDTWRRWMRSQFGSSAGSLESAVTSSSRILPLITSAHLPSAANHTYWPENYTNMPSIPGSEKEVYPDTPQPKCFGTVSPLDPQLFSTAVEHAADLMGENASPKYSPVEVAQWLDSLATAATSALTSARAKAGAHPSAAFRRVEADVQIQIGLGRFFAGRMRSAVLLAIFESSADGQAGLQAIDQYRLAREAWATLSATAVKTYRPDLSYGSAFWRRGHWNDRLASIDKDIAALTDHVHGAPRSADASRNTRAAIVAATGSPSRPAFNCVHKPTAKLAPGAALPVKLSLQQQATEFGPAQVVLHYRHVNQGERWLQAEMAAENAGYSAEIPAAYTQSPYAMQYYFELRAKSGAATLYPPFDATLSNQPYFVVESSQA